MRRDTSICTHSKWNWTVRQKGSLGIERIFQSALTKKSGLRRQTRSCPEMSFRRQIQQEAASPSASVDLSLHHKSTTVHIDVKAVWRGVLTSTKGTPERTCRHANGEGALPQSALLSYLYSGSPTLLSLSFLSLVFSSSLSSPHCNYTCSVKHSSRRGWATSIVGRKSAENARRSTTYSESPWKH